jgi:hypothetical protein
VGGIGILTAIALAIVIYFSGYDFTIDLSSEPAPIIYPTDKPAPSKMPTLTSTAILINTPSLTTTSTSTSTPSRTPTPTITPSPTPCIPQIEFNQDANCRYGPSTQYEVVTSFLEGQKVKIVGRNGTDPRWWLVEIPNYSSSQCWVSDTLGNASCTQDKVDIVQAPQLPPAAPGGLVVTKNGYCYIQISWNDVSGEDGYRIYRDGTLLVELPANTTYYQGVSSDYNSHSFYIQAYNTSGFANSNEQVSEYCSGSG